MFYHPQRMAGLAISVIIAASFRLSAQCNAPAALWLYAPQTSHSLTFNWAPVNNAMQYQVRYWESAWQGDKTIIEDLVTPPYTLDGLRKNTTYTTQVRSICGNAFSAWSNPVNVLSANSSVWCSSPTGIVVTTDPGTLHVNWSSPGSHTIRYRLGYSGDWLIPSGALSVENAPFSITGLTAGTYQVEIKQNCSASSGYYKRYIRTIADGCATPDTPTVFPGTSSATVTLPIKSGVTGYTVQYRPGINGNWNIVGINLLPPQAYLSPPFAPATLYQIRIQAQCGQLNSDYSAPATFITDGLVTSCLSNKDYGKNLNASEIAQFDATSNTPSPFTLGSMIGVNDGGLIFRSFQNANTNPITALTKQFRNFHTMDEDFDNTLTSYVQNTKPKETSPEGTPSYMFKNKNYYNIYHNTHGFDNITSAVELLQYSPQSWKDKFYLESDWSASGPAGIRASFENYTKKFIDELAPANGSDDQILVSNFQIGNELWDYPVKSDYHSLLIGARNAFVNKYGPKSAGGWKMKLLVSAFQAFRENNCNEVLRDQSNCGGSLSRHDFIGDYLDVLDCDVLKDLDAIDCHPYSFLPGTTSWTYPEDPASEGMQIRNLAAWLQANKNSSSGILANTRLWASEYGFDSNPITGVGEKTQSAYLIRGLLLHGRYHYEKVFFYNAFDHSRSSDPYYQSLYNSSGFWKLGTHPNNSAWASPLPEHGALAKASWYGMMDLKERFGGHVFYKALVEDSEAMIFLIAKQDGTEPYLVFWSPQLTNDANLNEDIAISKLVNWQSVLPEAYKIASTTGQTFSISPDAGQSYTAALGMDCGTTVLAGIRRNPAFIPLVSCATCTNNITEPGRIISPNPGIGTTTFDPGLIVNDLEATGGTGGLIEYQWQESSNNILFTDIPGATGLEYDPPTISQTTYFRRAAKRSQCPEYLYTQSVVITVTAGLCPVIVSFERKSNLENGCHVPGDYFYEIVLGNVTLDDQITMAGLPANGVNYTMSNLNGVPFTQSGFQSNLQYINPSSLRWMLNTNNGDTQTLQLFYCWANSYLEPSATTATADCSGITTPCIAVDLREEPKNRDVSPGFSGELMKTHKIKVHPNPGTNRMVMTYYGATSYNARLQLVSAMGQLVATEPFSELENQQQWIFSTENLPTGIYFLQLLTENGVLHQPWEKY